MGVEMTSNETPKTGEELDRWLLENSVCPVDHCELRRDGNYLVSTADPSRRYPVVYGIPVFLRHDDESTAWWARDSLLRAIKIADGGHDDQFYDPGLSGVHPHVQGIINSTGGYLYDALRGSMVEYPIPRIRVEKTEKKQLLLDCGCNWGRWTFSAARAGIPSIGVDPSLGAVIAARQIRRQLGLPCSFFVADCRFLPFKPDTFSDVFSYSVVQHFSKQNAAVAVREFARVTQPQGKCLLQMPNMFGIRSFYHYARRSFVEGEKFDVRYYRPGELKMLMAAAFSQVRLSVDGYFGLGIQPDDKRFMPFKNRMVINCSEFLRGLQKLVPPMLNLADSLYLHGVKGLS